MGFENRVLEVGSKIEEILRGLIGAVKQESPPWPVTWKADWFDGPLVAIRSKLEELKPKVPAELQSDFGSRLISDLRPPLTRKINAAVGSVF